MASASATGRRVVTVAEAFAENLRRRGVEVAFGLLSDDIMDLVVALEQAGIHYFGARQETQAIAMAEGYAFATGRLGVAAVGRGAATTNALTGTVFASRSGSKVLAIFGDAPVDVPRNASGPDIKRVEGVQASGVFAAAGVQTFSIPSAAAAGPVLDRAAGYAEQGRLAALFLPTSLQLQTLEVDDAANGGDPSLAIGEPAAAAAIATAAAVLAQSRRPLIVAGWGAYRSGAREAVEALGERLGAVLCTTVRGKDLFRGNPYDLGLLGSFSHSAARRFVDQADCVLVVGASLNLYTMSHGTSLPPVPIVQIDADRSSIGRFTAAHVAVVGDARVAAEQLLAALPARDEADGGFRTEETRRILSEFDPAGDYRDETTSRNIDARTLAVELDKLLPEDRNVVYDAGNFLSALPFLGVPSPGHFKMTSESGSIGLGLATAMGVARARPEATNVLVIGDGGLLMTLGELETVVREDVPLVIVVMNDRAYGAERHILELRGLPIGTSVFPEADFAAIAADLGIESVTVATLDDLRTKVAPLLADGTAPLLLDCLINPEIPAPFVTEMIDLLGKG